jgi:hypothetical protein
MTSRPPSDKELRCISGEIHRKVGIYSIKSDNFTKEEQKKTPAGVSRRGQWGPDVYGCCSWNGISSPRACIQKDESERRCTMGWLAVVFGAVLLYGGVAVYFYFGFQKMPL